MRNDSALVHSTHSHRRCGFCALRCVVFEAFFAKSVRFSPKQQPLHRTAVVVWRACLLAGLLVGCAVVCALCWRAATLRSLSLCLFVCSFCCCCSRSSVQPASTATALSSQQHGGVAVLSL